MEYSPPPLFKQGASARAKVIFFALIAIALLVADSRLHSLGAIRHVVGIALYPLQSLALLPRDAAYGIGGYFSSASSLRQENENLKRQQVANAQSLQQGQQLFAENAQLRKLLSASERLPVKSLMSEILYDTRDAFTRKIVLDRGEQHGVVPGQPVIDDLGVVGQVTRTFPFTSEVTLLTDKDHAISVQVVRSGVRSVAYGRGQSGVLDLRFMAANADIQKGDVLVTSGIDGVYPAGLSVAKVMQVENKTGDAFARVVCQPSAGIDRNKQLLVLLAEAKLPPRPEPEDGRDKKEKPLKKHGNESAKEPSKAVAAPEAKTAIKEPVKETGVGAAKTVAKEAAKETAKETAAPGAKAGPKVGTAAAGAKVEAKDVVKQNGAAP